MTYVFLSVSSKSGHGGLPGSRHVLRGNGAAHLVSVACVHAARLHVECVWKCDARVQRYVAQDPLALQVVRISSPIVKTRARHSVYRTWLMAARTFAGGNAEGAVHHEGMQKEMTQSHNAEAEFELNGLLEPSPSSIIKKQKWTILEIRTLAGVATADLWQLVWNALKDARYGLDIIMFPAAVEEVAAAPANVEAAADMG